jgi:hypothetical protein
MRFKAVYTDNNGTSYEWFTGYRRVHAELQQPPSQLWFCTVCGTVYARVEITKETEVIPYISIACRCESHTRDIPYSIYTGGSILAENLNNVMEMPAELVEKEFWIHLRETERLNEN